MRIRTRERCQSNQKQKKRNQESGACILSLNQEFTKQARRATIIPSDYQMPTEDNSCAQRPRLGPYLASQTFIRQHNSTSEAEFDVIRVANRA